MSNTPTSTMTQYLEGCLVSRELADMLVSYAAEARFDDAFQDYEEQPITNWKDRYANQNARTLPR
jgi:hypothetical protein